MRTFLEGKTSSIAVMATLNPKAEHWNVRPVSHWVQMSMLQVAWATQRKCMQSREQPMSAPTQRTQQVFSSHIPSPSVAICSSCTLKSVLSPVTFSNGVMVCICSVQGVALLEGMWPCWSRCVTVGVVSKNPYPSCLEASILLAAFR